MNVFFFKGFVDGSKQGTFYWDGPDGYRRIVSYTADEKGFRPTIVKVGCFWLFTIISFYGQDQTYEAENIFLIIIFLLRIISIE